MYRHFLQSDGTAQGPHISCCYNDIAIKLLKTTFSPSCNLITQYNPLLPYFKTIIRKHLPILYSNQQISVTDKRNKNLR